MTHEENMKNPEWLAEQLTRLQKETDKANKDKDMMAQQVEQIKAKLAEAAKLAQQIKMLVGSSE